MAFGREVAVTITFVVLGMRCLLVLGGMECETLPVELCAFSVSSTGFRCILEKNYSPAETSSLYQCKSSAIMAEEMREWIESEECVETCGLHRMSVGMSTDELNEYSEFSYKLCSDKCLTSCPNVVDLYLTLAAEEGIYLPHLCEAHNKYSRRIAFQFQKGKANGNGNGNGNDIDNENERESEDGPAPAPGPTAPAPNEGID
ncbi:hypothetical protein SUGI_0775590 [Cryptomeria japonica]|uniref:uncharacterized protein LOC131074576 n=1 Tax=Cryptomeria japonica TaxID=3369 RepID=UPI0024147A2B|nr:uncharacterized protein LOC131074576 [Cryptomeria japonica]GLJ38100.1 hypothetical protein SUGI_0775590 [Cryptomeria japonica]